ncbi:hypothetical protein LOAG_12275 [Loa loa]|uniref:Uncharacterized protein n=1 Tax=Loa loa TaxID=7209 RepID=A0A1S0TLL8_LOALO|nr:hypothetical protein LOAG_12275 [Loa loa]EFO16232.1 hypothetical protein LOAG_12275 [Loa loa]
MYESVLKEEKLFPKYPSTNQHTRVRVLCLCICVCVCVRTYMSVCMYLHVLVCMYVSARVDNGTTGYPGELIPSTNLRPQLVQSREIEEDSKKQMRMMEALVLFVAPEQ